MPDPTGIVSHEPDFHRGVAWKTPVRCATTEDIAIATALNAGDSIDGVTLVAGDRVLVKDQSTATQNGIYVAGATPVRAYDMDQDAGTSVPATYPGEVLGAHVYVIAGTANAGTRWYVTNTTAVVIGTDDIDWVVWSGGGVGTETPVEHGSMGTTETLDFSAGATHRGTLDDDVTVTVTGFVVSEALYGTFGVAQDGTGGYGITWDGDVVFAGDDQPAQGANEVTWYVIWSTEGDSVVYGAKAGSGDVAAGTPALTLSTTNSAGSASTFVATDATVALFDATAPVTQAFGDAASHGVTGYAADAGHRHGMPAAPSGGRLLIGSGHAVPIEFEDILQASDGSDFLYSSS